MFEGAMLHLKDAEPDLIDRARAGNDQAYDVLMLRWQSRVFHYLLRLVGRREDALDLRQDVFWKAYQSLRNLEDATKFPAWLFRIARNEAFAALRKSKSKSEVFIELKTGESSCRMVPIELYMDLQNALMGLAANQRDVVILKLYHGYTFEEMAQTLSCPVSTVKSRFYTSIALLNQMLATVNLETVGQLSRVDAEPVYELPCRCQPGMAKKIPS
jgi:RNA polymerase sigma-70 factor (ECF subfamily)